jgi:acetyl esterase
VPLDPDVALFLRGAGQRLTFPAGARNDPRLAADYLAKVRAALSAPAIGPREPVHEVFDEVLAGGVAVRVYRGTDSDGAPLLVYFHGGGWVSGGLEMNDALCRRLANLTRCTLVSVDYRLAPEHPYPAALDDCLAAIQWAREEAKRLGADPRHVSVAGTSSGGNLAAAVALVSRDRNLATLRAQLLLYPVLDHAMTTSSYLANGAGYLLERTQMEWYWDQYLPQRDGNVSPYAAPAAATDLSLLPSAVVVSAEFDPLCDEAELYASRLAAAGVATELLRFSGQIHGFLTFLGAMPAADTAITEIAAAARRAWTS